MTSEYFVDLYIFFGLPFSILIIAIIGMIFHERTGRKLDHEITEFKERERQAAQKHLDEK